MKTLHIAQLPIFIVVGSVSSAATDAFAFALVCSEIQLTSVLINE